MTATIYLGDCVSGMAEHLAEGSVDLTVTSIPFGSLFQYSAKNEDIGNNTDGVDMRAGMFGLHMRFFVAQLARVQGRPEVTLIDGEELARIEELIAAGTWPDGWDGSEARGDDALDLVLAEGVVQPLLFGRG